MFAVAPRGKKSDCGRFLALIAHRYLRISPPVLSESKCCCAELCRSTAVVTPRGGGGGGGARGTCWFSGSVYDVPRCFSVCLSMSVCLSVFFLCVCVCVCLGLPVHQARGEAPAVHVQRTVVGAGSRPSGV